MINFESIRWKNILSTGNTFTEIKLNKSSSTLIVGQNGAGKSTILDALCFGLFGKPFRKINKPNLLNSINNQQGVVEIEFSIGSKSYKIIRGIKPNVFEIYCDGSLLNQDAKAKDYQDFLEKNILKLNFKSFTQVVILGSASFVPFMQLSASDRRLIIEDLLDIQIFSSMNVVVKDKLSGIKDKLQEVKYNIDLTNEKIKLQVSNSEHHREQLNSEIDFKQKKIIESEQQIIEIEGKVQLIMKHIDVMNGKINDKIAVDGKNKKLIQLEAKMESNIKKVEKDIDFYHNNDSCPTCKQNLDSDFKLTQIQERLGKKNEIQNGLDQIYKEISNLNTRITEIDEIQRNIMNHQNEVTKLNSSISSINEYIKNINKDIAFYNQKKKNLVDDNDKLRELNDDLLSYNKRYEELINEKQYYDYASLLLKDSGIKTKIIKQYLPIMNKLVNKYLTAMDFFVNFNINENFEETIKSRHRDEFVYANFSEGEKQKIDLALLFTWRQIAKLKNSANTNLLILDEVFDSSLDTSSVELLMNLLKELSSDTNVFVISHKGDQLFDKFRSIIRFIKKNNFSQVEK